MAGNIFTGNALSALAEAIRKVRGIPGMRTAI
jgi:hypothetical protein